MDTTETIRDAAQNDGQPPNPARTALENISDILWLQPERLRLRWLQYMYDGRWFFDPAKPPSEEEMLRVLIRHELDVGIQSEMEAAARDIASAA